MTSFSATKGLIYTSLFSVLTMTSTPTSISVLILPDLNSKTAVVTISKWAEKHCVLRQLSPTPTPMINIPTSVVNKPSAFIYLCFDWLIDPDL